MIHGAPVWGSAFFRYLLYRFRFSFPVYRFRLIVFVEDNTASAAAAAAAGGRGRRQRQEAVGPRCAAGGARQCHWSFGAVFEVKPSWRVPPTQAVLLECDHGHSWPFKFRSCSVWSGSCWTEAECHRLDLRPPPLS